MTDVLALAYACVHSQSTKCDAERLTCERLRMLFRTSAQRATAQRNRATGDRTGDWAHRQERTIMEAGPESEHRTSQGSGGGGGGSGSGYGGNGGANSGGGHCAHSIGSFERGRMESVSESDEVTLIGAEPSTCGTNSIAGPDAAAPECAGSGAVPPTSRGPSRSTTSRSSGPQWPLPQRSGSGARSAVSDALPTLNGSWLPACAGGGGWGGLEPLRGGSTQLPSAVVPDRARSTPPLHPTAPPPPPEAQPPQQRHQSRQPPQSQPLRRPLPMQVRSHAVLDTGSPPVAAPGEPLG
jgi:hypothetical protein